jgi:hypothetical protein
MGSKYDYMFKLRIGKGRNLATVTLTQCKNRAQALAAFREHAQGAAKGVRVELLDDEGKQLARNW